MVRREALVLSVGLADQDDVALEPDLVASLEEPAAVRRDAHARLARLVRLESDPLEHGRVVVGVMYHLARREGVEDLAVLAELARAEVLHDEVGVVALRRVAARALGLHQLVQPPGERDQQPEDAQRQPGGGADHRLCLRPVAPGRAFQRALRAHHELAELAHRAVARRAARVTRWAIAFTSGTALATATARPQRARTGASGRSSPTNAHCGGVEPQLRAQRLEVGELVVHAQDHVRHAELARPSRQRPPSAARRGGPWPRRSGRASSGRGRRGC